MKKVKIGIIGTGVGIRTHLKGFRMVKDAEVVAISGSSLERSKEFAEKFDIPMACADYKELCDIEDIDLVCITAPNNFHKEMVEYAISKHKHIICEKPLVDNVNDAKKLCALAKNYDKLLFIDHQLRFNPYISTIKKLIDNDTLGKVYSVKLNQQGAGFADKNAKWSWSFDDKQGGGVRLAMASHLNDLMQYWFNNRPILSVSAFMSPVTNERVDDKGKIRKVYASTLCTAMINFSHELCAQYYINAGSYVGSRFDISIFGDKGEITFSLQDKLHLYLRNKVGEIKEVEVKGVFDDEKENKASIFSGSFRYLASLVVKAIKTNNFKGLNKAASFEDAVINLTMLEAIKEAANTNTAVVFKKEKNKYC